MNEVSLKLVFALMGFLQVIGVGLLSWVLLSILQLRDRVIVVEQLLDVSINDRLKRLESSYEEIRDRIYTYRD